MHINALPILSAASSSFTNPMIISVSLQMWEVPFDQKKKSISDIGLMPTHGDCIHEQRLGPNGYHTTSFKTLPKIVGWTVCGISDIDGKCVNKCFTTLYFIHINISATEKTHQIYLVSFFCAFFFLLIFAAWYAC